MSGTFGGLNPAGMPSIVAPQDYQTIEDHLRAVGIPTDPSPQFQQAAPQPAPQPAPQLQPPGGAMLPDGTFIPTSVDSTAPGPDASLAGDVAKAAAATGKAIAGANVASAQPSPGPSGDQEAQNFPQGQPANPAPANPGIYVPPTDAGGQDSGIYAPPTDTNTGMAKPPPASNVQEVKQLPATPSTGPDGADVNSVQSNNFGNIRPVGGQGFNSYPTPVDGIAAMSHQLSLYAVGSPATGGKPLTTLNQLTATYAPKGDGKNDPVAYAKRLGAALNVDPDAPINLADPGLQSKLIPAMTAVEQGRPINFDPQTLQQGIQLAQSGKPIQTGAPLQTTPPGAGNVTLAATSTEPVQGPQSSADQRLAAVQALQSGGGMSNLAAQLQAAGLNPKTMMGNPLLAIASGFAGKRSFGEGMSSAFGNLNNLYQQRGDLAFKLANMDLANRRLDQQANYQNQELGVRRTEADTQLQKLRAGTGPAFQKQDGSWVRYNSYGEEIPTGAPASYANSDPNRRGDQSFASKQAAQASADISALQSTAPDDIAAKENITGALQQLQRNPGMFGPSVKAVVQRQLALWGLGDADQLQAYQKMSADQRAKYLETATAGHAGSMLRSAASQKMFSQAVADASTDPHAAQYVFDTQLAMVNARDALRKALADGSVKRDANFSQSESDFYTKWFQSHPMPIFSPGYNSQFLGGPSAESQQPQQQSSAKPSISSFWTK